VKLPSDGKNVETIVEACENTGSFSLGGLYEGSWEKLTYYYPQPWAGTYVTINVDGKHYTTSKHPRDATPLDEYLTTKPQITAKLLTTKWLLPENIDVEQTIQHKTNSTYIKITAINHATKNHNIGIRFHIDTLIGVNDGAPIYVPGDGLKTTEDTYDGDRLTFKYWKAYNHPTKPTIVATGTLDPLQGFTYPDKVVIADWKKSKDTAWEYKTNKDQTILGDSAVLLYYNPQPIPPEGSRTAITGYGSSQPVLAEDKGFFGITEVIVDQVYGLYCPNNNAKITVDTLSINTTNTGTIQLDVIEDGKTIHTETKPTGKVGAEEIKSLDFNWIIPETKRDKTYDIKTTLKNQSNQKIDEKTKKNAISVKLSECEIEKESKTPLWLILLLGLLILAAVTTLPIVYYYSKKGTVEIIKAVDENGLVKVKVRNNTRNPITECVVEDRIPTQAEADVKTLHVNRKDNKLIWEIGEMQPKAEATLEYSIRGASVLPPARVSWGNGQAVTD